jgi:hypothetical protein
VENSSGIELIQGNDQPQLGADAHFPKQVMLDALQPFTPPNKPVSIKSLHPTTRSSSRNGTKTPPPSGKHLGHYKALLSWLTQEPSLTDPADDIINLKINYAN